MANVKKISKTDTNLIIKNMKNSGSVGEIITTFNILRKDETVEDSYIVNKKDNKIYVTSAGTSKYFTSESEAEDYIQKKFEREYKQYGRTLQSISSTRGIGGTSTSRT